MGVKVLIWEYVNYIKGGWRSMNNLCPAAQPHDRGAALLPHVNAKSNRYTNLERIPSSLYLEQHSTSWIHRQRRDVAHEARR